jgi:hypothetical protein
MPPTGRAAGTGPISLRYRDCRRFLVLPAEQDLSGGWGLFFDGRTSATGETHAVGWATLEILVEFIATDANGFGMQARNFGNLLDAAMPTSSGLASGDPASFLFVQAAENQIEVPMVLFLQMIASLTCRTCALPNRAFLCHLTGLLPWWDR